MRSPGRPQSFRYQHRPVDHCGPAGQGGMAQVGRTRGGVFQGEIDRCRGSYDWTTACSTSSLSERDGNKQVEDNPEQACMY